MQRDMSLEKVTLKAGEGTVVAVGGEKIGVCRDNRGVAHAVSAVCTHQGCIVGWNASRQSWECPCHGSRFSAEGAMLSGPAAVPLFQKGVPVIIA